MEHPLFFPIVNLFGFIGVLTINTLANTAELNGYNTGELSANYPNEFVPPGWVFSIWGIIYLLNTIFVIWSFQNRGSELLTNIGWWYLIISICNIGWLVLWHYEYVWTSTLVMIAFLLSLIRIHAIILPYRDQLSGIGEVAVSAHFGVYLGWISVATVANITTGFISIDWNGLGISEEIWTAIIIVIVLCISLFMVISQSNTYFGLVILWAIGGILVNQTDTMMIAIPAGLTVILTMIAIGWDYAR